MKSGVYIITSISENKHYIGQSVDWKERLFSHKSALKYNYHRNLHLQNAYNKYGKNNFIFEILEETEEKFLFSLENYWCNLLNVHNSKYGYNIQFTGSEGCSRMSQETKNKISSQHVGKPKSTITKNRISESRKGIKFSENTKIKMSLVKQKPIYQYDLEDNFIKEWVGATTASKELNISKNGIQHVLYGKRLTAGGFKWVANYKINSSNK